MVLLEAMLFKEPKPEVNLFKQVTAFWAALQILSICQNTYFGYPGTGSSPSPGLRSSSKENIFS